MTNGKGILKLDADFLENVRLAQIKYHRPAVLICLTYNGEEFFSNSPSENEFWRLFKMMGNLTTEIEINTHSIVVGKKKNIYEFYIFLLLEPRNKEEYLNVVKSFYKENSLDEVFIIIFFLLMNNSLSWSLIGEIIKIIYWGNLKNTNSLRKKRFKNI